MIHVLDTHALTRFVEDYRKLGAAGRAVCEDADALLIVPTIVLAEARFMITKNKLDLVWDDIARAVEADSRLLPFPLTVEVLHLLPDNLEMHDAIICATAILLREALGEDVRVITRDHEIIASGIVQTVW